MGIELQLSDWLASRVFNGNRESRKFSNYFQSRFPGFWFPGFSRLSRQKIVFLRVLRVFFLNLKVEKLWEKSRFMTKPICDLHWGENMLTVSILLIIWFVYSFFPLVYVMADFHLWSNSRKFPGFPGMRFFSLESLEWFHSRENENPICQYLTHSAI